jgi:hypothetical protein
VKCQPANDACARVQVRPRWRWRWNEVDGDGPPRPQRSATQVRPRLQSLPLPVGACRCRQPIIHRKAVCKWKRTRRISKPLCACMLYLWPPSPLDVRTHGSRPCHACRQSGTPTPPDPGRRRTNEARCTSLCDVCLLSRAARHTRHRGHAMLQSAGPAKLPLLLVLGAFRCWGSPRACAKEISRLGLALKKW